MSDLDNLDELSFSFLDEDEKKALLDIIENLQEDRKEQTICRQVREIKPFKEWVESEYYCGYLAKSIYPHWKKVLTEVFDEAKPGEECNELIITGGLGCGKTTAAVVALIYTLYKNSCFVNLAARYNLIPGSLISEFFFTVSRTQAELTSWGNFKSYVDSIPYFNDHFLRNKRLNSMLAYPENFLVSYGSSSEHVIGMNVCAALLDEANFFTKNAQNKQGGVDFSAVKTFYQSLIQRGASRFLANGVNHFLMVLVSSNTTTSSMTDDRIKLTQGDPHVKVINARLWDVKPAGTYSATGFWVFTGNSSYDCQLVDDIADLNLIAESYSCGPYYGDVDYVIRNEVSEVFKQDLVWIPDDFRKQFERDCAQSLQDIAGVSVAPAGRLFSNHKMYHDSTVGSGLVSPFTKPYFILSTQPGTPTITDYIDRQWRPVRGSEKCIRCGGADQSLKTDRTGLAVSYIERWEQNKTTGEWSPYYVTEFVCAVIPPRAPNSVSIRKCSDLWYIVRDYYNLPLGKITYDSYASSGIIQDLQAQGFDADTRSVDRDAQAYLTWITSILEGRWRMPAHPIVEAEIFNLVLHRDTGKVDHEGKTNPNDVLSGTSKDVCDAICHSIMNCLETGQAQMEANYNELRSREYSSIGAGYEEIYSEFDVKELYQDLWGVDKMPVPENDTTRLYKEERAIQELEDLWDY